MYVLSNECVVAVKMTKIIQHALGTKTQDLIMQLHELKIQQVPPYSTQLFSYPKCTKIVK